MITITKEKELFHFNVEGLHKLWALKSELTIPAENIIKAYQDEAELNGWKGWRIPGTHIPGLITAGTFHLSGNKIFWDVVDKKKAIIIDLADESYQKLIIEVEDPESMITLLNDKQS